MDEEKKKIVEDYLIKKERRSLKRIELGSNLNHKIFILTIAMLVALPLIPNSNEKDFIIPNHFFELTHSFLNSIYFGILIGLLFFNIVIGIVNIVRKTKYRKIVKEIQELKSVGI
jgi:predicted transcriptional regulator